MAVRHVSRQVRGISPEPTVKGKPKLKADDIGKLKDDESDEADEAEAESDSPQPSVRIRGKRVDEPAEEVEDAADEEESAEEESAKRPTRKQKLAMKLNPTRPQRKPPPTNPAWRTSRASALRIRNLPGIKEHASVIEQLEAASRSEEPVQYELPPIDLLLPNETVALEAHEQEVRQKAKILEKTFANFGFKVKVVEIETGPVIAQYEIELEAGLRLAKIT